MDETAGGAMPEPESGDLGRYLEDTITIDWQAPALMTESARLLAGVESHEERLRVLFGFVRDEIREPTSGGASAITCSASQVLRERVGSSFSQSHLLAGLLRCAGFPTGFCYARLVDEATPSGFALRGFNAVYWASAGEWIFLDALHSPGEPPTEARFAPPWSLSRAPDLGEGESFLPCIYRRPGKRIIDLLERAPDLEALRRNLPEGL